MIAEANVLTKTDKKADKNKINNKNNKKKKN